MRFLMIIIFIFSCFVESNGNLKNENKILWIQPINNNWESLDSIDVKKYYYGTDFGQIRGFVNPPFFKISCLDSLNWVYFAQDYENYCIYRATTDGGLNWETRYVDTSKMYPDHRPRKIYSIAYIKNELILCGADSGYILKSTDGGFNWSKKMMTKDTSDFADSTNTNFSKGRIIKLKMYNNIGYAFTNNGKLYITEDWGDSWKKIILDVSEGIINRIDSFSCADTNAIFISFLSVNNDKDSLVNFYSSFDRGKTFDKIISVKGWYDTSYPRSIEYITRNVGWGTTSVNISKDNNNYKPFLFKTINGGKSWNLVLTDSAFGLSTYSVPYFSDSLNLAVFHGNVIYITNDGGSNWYISKIEYENHPEYNNYGRGNISYYSKDKFITGHGPFIVKYKGNLTDVKEKESIDEDIINTMIVNDIMRINIQEKPSKTLHIYSILGEKLYELTEIDINNLIGKNTFEIDVSFLRSGIYFLRCGERIIKFIKL
ncbi:MAG: hypothetical protein N2319_08740 [Candidatus Kapabacteria bacterium]|nr:hypothetical protein [Candidatus Kapabacteria bacterium]